MRQAASPSQSWFPKCTFAKPCLTESGALEFMFGAVAAQTALIVALLELLK
jgi:hypothetical protein